LIEVLELDLEGDGTGVGDHDRARPRLEVADLADRRVVRARHQGEGLVARLVGVGVDRREVDLVLALLESGDGVAVGTRDRVALGEAEAVAALRAAGMGVLARPTLEDGAGVALGAQPVAPFPAVEQAALVAAEADQDVVPAGTDGEAPEIVTAVDLDPVVPRAAIILLCHKCEEVGFG
jgi:hypothetical protein